jgi:Glyoxalase-like domain
MSSLTSPAAAIHLGMDTSKNTIVVAVLMPGEEVPVIDRMWNEEARCGIWSGGSLTGPRCGPVTRRARAALYRKLRLPDSNIRILLQKTSDKKTSKERMHLDLETDDVEAEVRRLEALGATRWDHQKERGFDFWVMRDPWLNEFCVLQPEFPELLAKRTPWPE